MERALGEMRARLEASEAGRREAEGRAKQLASDLEDSTRVFRLHYDAIIEKDKEIEGLREAIKILSAEKDESGGGATKGGAPGGGASSAGGAGGASSGAPSPRRDWLGGDLAADSSGSARAPAFASEASTAQPISGRSWLDDARGDESGWDDPRGNAYRIVPTGSLGGGSGDEDEDNISDDDSLLGSDDL